ncbi:MAG: hypothetical protein ACRC13_01015 [Tannerellaceae bacterium]
MTIKTIQFLFCSLFFLVSCGGNNTENHFLGEITEFDLNDPSIVEETLNAKPIHLDGIYDGWIATHDSLVFFWSHRYNTHFFNVFNLNSGQFLGSFVPKGSGPDDVRAAPPISHLYEEHGELKTVINAHNEQQFLIWNITKSIELGKTIFDKRNSYQRGREGYIDITYLDEECLLIYQPSSEPTDPDDQTSLPRFQKLKLNSGELLRDYPIFKNPIIPEEKQTEPFTFGGLTAIKEDKTKALQAMLGLGQINIIDLNTGEVKGVREKNSPTFSSFYKDIKDRRSYYIRVQANNSYIIAVWLDCPPADVSKEFTFDQLHVFNWEGELIKKIRLDTPVQEIWLDKITNRFYGYNPYREKLYEYNLGLE